MSAILDLSGKFQKNPICLLYYVTTGKWNPDDTTLEGRRQAEIEDLKNTRLFSEVVFTPVDAEQIHKLYRQSRNAVARAIHFRQEGGDFSMRLMSRSASPRRISISSIKAKVFPRVLATQLSALDNFHEAEAYHQNYLANHPDDSYIVYKRSAEA